MSKSINNDTQRILDELANAVISMDEDKATSKAKEAVKKGVDAYLAISKGLARGMEIMGDQYEKGICFIPELLVASDAMYAGMDILKPHLKTEKPLFIGGQPIVVIGVIEGDTHDIGKNLVKTMFEVNGFKMIDLGRDVPPSRFIDAAIREKANLVCVSCLLTTAMTQMSDIITGLAETELKPKIKVMIGGACISASFAQRIGADGYAPNAIAAVAKAKKLLNGKKNG